MGGRERKNEEVTVVVAVTRRIFSGAVLSLCHYQVDQ